MHTNTYRANGKLLLSGEYAVLDGALSLALPTRFGQTLRVEPATSPSDNPPKLYWKAYNADGKLWLEARLRLPDFALEEANRQEEAQLLARLLAEADRIAPGFAQSAAGVASTHLEFPRHWGLGSSSTLVYLLGQWSGADPFALLWSVWDGSGYDLACAQAQGPLFYRLSGRLPAWEPIAFAPDFAPALHFVHLGRKQDSGEAVAAYRRLPEEARRRLAHEVSQISEAMRRSSSLAGFEQLLEEHERLLGGILGQTPIKEARFPGFQGVMKSLGAWGGDFALATGASEYVRSYFKAQGLSEIVSFGEMIHQAPARAEESAEG
jgi:mevalonate kinase